VFDISYQQLTIVLNIKYNLLKIFSAELKFSSLQLQEVLGDILEFSIKAAKSDQESDKYISW